ncbi:actin depolymerizing protein [Metschnikowia bicuspidata var. bicuspidata NRRL YB-4993]|uniref:Actin depolymerizing protein n=1 Tax=Metschnikowia bicuspidata var. bicuspidata NRRL YB-4993 TaxID=869754 RepID=A0A1A0HI47_9ASCO|nr:actin depolymerizing protein [Metschnikowia bicuspidata var. bicuspidata NRRL YB-4993]OBA23839.1 actin depolymerizing protein [Metschnikowia bicuspidata var. bicuspidata NRRL YB-4993]
MSTQSGIKASSELIDLANGSQSAALVITLSQDSTQLVVDESFESPSNTQINCVLDALKDHFSAEFPEPKFAIISPNASHEGYFVSFIPDLAPIRQKMLFASTKNTLLQQLGTKFSKKNTVEFSELRELDHEEFGRAVLEPDQSSTLTAKERDLQTLDSLQNLTLSHSSASAYKRELPSMDTQKETSLFFKIELDLDCLLRSDLYSKLVVMNIDTDAETLSLSAEVSGVTVNNLVDAISLSVAEGLQSSPAYVLYGYEQGKLAFIYACPSGCKVKSRIMYAANKQGLLSHLKNDYLPDQEIVETMEVGDFDEIDTLALEKKDVTDTPVTGDSRMKFSKPRGPRRR